MQIPGSEFYNIIKKITTWEKFYRAVMHIPVGIFILMAFMLGVIIGLPYLPAVLLGCGLGFLGFLLFRDYELNEDRNIHDFAFYDILGALIGFFGGIVSLYIYVIILIGREI